MIIIAAVVLVVIMVGFFVAYIFKDSSDSAGSKQQKTDLSLPENQLALEGSQNPALKLQERFLEAVRTKDFESCGRLADEVQKITCVNNIAMALAQEKKDISYCQKITNNTEFSVAGCERSIIVPKSLKEKDAAVCEEAKDPELQKQCRGTFWTSEALKKENIGLCDNLSDSIQKTACQDSYIFQKEFTKNQGNFDCNKFGEPNIKDDCSAYIKSAKPKDLAFCQGLKSSVFKMFCVGVLRQGIPVR